MADLIFGKENKSFHSRPLVDELTREIVVNTLFVGVSSCISLLGIVANGINIAVYAKQGVRDSVTVQFLSLSVSDCAFSAIVLTTCVSALLSSVRPDVTVLDPGSVAYGLSPVREKMYSLSVAIIFLMSVERCFCVAFPFTVRSMFTKSRTIAAVLCIVLVLLVLIVLEYLTRGISWQYDQRFNSTRLLLWYSPNANSIDVVRNTILAGVLPVLSGAATTLCVLYMTKAIRASNRFRQSVVKTKRAVNSSNGDQTNNESKLLHETMTSFSRQDARMIRTVITIDIFFIICNVPKCMVLASSVVKIYIPLFNFIAQSKYRNVSMIIMTLTYTFEPALSLYITRQVRGLELPFPACFARSSY